MLTQPPWLTEGQQEVAGSRQPISPWVKSSECIQVNRDKTHLFFEYVWCDAFGQMRSKIRVIKSGIEADRISTIYPDNPLLLWNYDGSSCGQSTTEDSEVTLHPVAIYKNPLLDMEDGYLVLCESVDRSGLPVKGSNYQYAKEIFENPRVKNADFWFGIEQEYFFVNTCTKYPVGFMPYTENKDLLQGSFYCGVGGNHIYDIQRQIAEKHMKVCLSMDIPISGINAEVAPSQWEYQVGISHGIQAAHDLWVSRYILKKIAESHDFDVTFHPKPICPPEFMNHWNGSGAHVNVSTAESRNSGGFEKITTYMKKLESRHLEHMALYGEENERRLTGKHETANMNTFSYGVGSRNTSIRIPYTTERDGKGYFEDRRPAANMDPYLVCGILADTISM